MFDFVKIFVGIYINISLTNVSEKTGLRRLGWMQRQRCRVERVFENAKAERGMAHYQVRKWSAWHHHMALVMMARLFMLTEKIRHKEAYPLLSCDDIEALLARFSPLRDVTKEEIINQLENRHLMRQQAIKSMPGNKKWVQVNLTKSK